MLEVQGRALDEWEGAKTFEDHVRCHSAYFGIRGVFNLMITLWSKVDSPDEIFSEEEENAGTRRYEPPEAGY